MQILIYVLGLFGEIPSTSHDAEQLETTKVFFCYGENNSLEGFQEKGGREGGNMREGRMEDIIPKRTFKHWISWLIEFHFIALLLRITLCKIVSERRGENLFYVYWIFKYSEVACTLLSLPLCCLQVLAGCRKHFAFAIQVQKDKSRKAEDQKITVFSLLAQKHHDP